MITPLCYFFVNLGMGFGEIYQLDNLNGHLMKIFINLIFKNQLLVAVRYSKKVASGFFAAG